MSKNKAVTTKPRTGGNEKLLFRCMGWKGGKWIPTNSNGFRREHDPDPKQGLRQRWCSPASGMEPDSLGTRHRAVREEHGMQWRRGLAHWVTLAMTVLLKSPVGTVSPASQCKNKCPAWRAMVLLLCPLLREASPGLFLQRLPRGRSGGLAEVERLKGKCSSSAHCPGKSVQENKQLKLGFHVKPNADTIYCLWVCQLTASWLSTGWKEAPAPTAIPACSLCSTSSPTVKVENHYLTGWHHLLRPLSLWEGP